MPLDRPFVTVSFAVSEDLCLSSTRGAPSRVSCDEALRVTHELRTAHEALLVGVGTVLSDDPVLTTRLALGPSPLRVVLDSRLRTPASARVLRSTAQAPLLITTSLATEAREEELAQAGAEILRVASDPRGVALPAALTRLRTRGVTSVMVEGGSDVLESFFSTGLIDFLAVTISPQRLDNAQAVRLGPHARAALAGWMRSPERVGVDALFSGPLLATVKAAS
jgi:GTP cyclohydrolase II